MFKWLRSSGKTPEKQVEKPIIPELPTFQKEVLDIIAALEKPDYLFFINGNRHHNVRVEKDGDDWCLTAESVAAGIPAKLDYAIANKPGMVAAMPVEPWLVWEQNKLRLMQVMTRIENDLKHTELFDYNLGVYIGHDLIRGEVHIGTAKDLTFIGVVDWYAELEGACGVTEFEQHQSEHRLTVRKEQDATRFVQWVERNTGLSFADVVSRLEEAELVVRERNKERPWDRIRNNEFVVGQHVRLVPKDPYDRLTDIDTWNCYRVNAVLDEREQLLFAGPKATYLPNLILNDREGRRFHAFAGDYVSSPQPKPKAKNKSN